MRMNSYLRMRPERRADQEQRKWRKYEAMKREFLQINPAATPQEIQRAFRGFADELGL